jgi:hypothetical protein
MSLSWIHLKRKKRGSIVSDCREELPSLAWLPPLPESLQQWRRKCLRL